MMKRILIYKPFVFNTSEGKKYFPDGIQEVTDDEAGHWFVQANSTPVDEQSQASEQEIIAVITSSHEELLQNHVALVQKHEELTKAHNELLRLHFEPGTVEGDTPPLVVDETAPIVTKQGKK